MNAPQSDLELLELWRSGDNRAGSALVKRHFESLHRFFSTKAQGTGLGLSIVDELARAYGGAVTLGDATIGGLKAVLILPRAEA